MRNKPAISLILNASDNAQYLMNSLECILAQTFSDFEVIVFGNESANTAHTRVESYKDSRIQYNRNFKNLGNYEVVNEGLKRARGKYLCIMVANTIYVPDRFKVQWRYMEQNPKIGCTASGIEWINQYGEMVNSYLPVSAYQKLKVALIRENCLVESSLMFKTSFLRNFNLNFDPTFQDAADYDFIVRACNCFAVRGIDAVLVKSRIQKNKFSFKDFELKKLNKNKVRIKILDQFKIAAANEDVELHLRLMQNEYLTDLELKSAAAWLDRLLLRNRELKKYNSKYLLHLFENVLEQSFTKNRLGGWSIEKDLVAFINTKLPFNRTILEFGSGTGTDALLRNYRVISIEHNKAYAFKRAPHHACLHSPLKGNWYDRGKVQKALTKKPDLLLIDGPPGDLRQGILDNLDLFFGIKIPIIFDDIDRELDKHIMITFCNVLKYNYQICYEGKRLFAFCIRA